MIAIQLINFGSENRNRNCANSPQEFTGSFNDILCKVEYQSKNF